MTRGQLCTDDSAVSPWWPLVQDAFGQKENNPPSLISASVPVPSLVLWDPLWGFAMKSPSMGITQRFNVSDAYHFLLLLNRNSWEVWVFQFFNRNSDDPKTQNCTARLHVSSYFALRVRKDIIFQSNAMISEQRLSAPQRRSFTFLCSIKDRTEMCLFVFQSI